MKYLVLLLIAMASPAWAEGAIDVADPVLVSELNRLQDQVDTVSTAIMGCMETGREHQACMCEHRGKITQFNATVHGLMSRHPTLATLDLVQFRAADGVSVAQSLNAIRAQAASEPSCP